MDGLGSGWVMWAVLSAVFAAATFGVLVLCALPIMGLKTGLTQSQQFIKTPEAIVAADRIAQSFNAGSVDPTRVYTTADANKVTSAINTVAAVAHRPYACRRRGSGQSEGDDACNAATARRRGRP